ncbi:putative HTH psq-type domain-containing protein [Seiridium cardinale]|uniref:HTH psq-type domain-containing protein n=1 Tax=Seiridium cardinale TaxID=138064 RepID=A0ABR2XIK7_9PEZI
METPTPLANASSPGTSFSVTRIEKELGVTKSGRLVHTELAIPETLKIILADDERRLRITTNVNSTLTDTITLIQVQEWDQRFGEFIQQVNRELSEHYEGASIPFPTIKQVEPIIEQFSRRAISATGFSVTIKSRLELQLNVLYNLTAQAANDLNLQVATAAGLDSAAMKTLAFVTTVFLPPSFVALVGGIGGNPKKCTILRSIFRDGAWHEETRVFEFDSASRVSPSWLAVTR